MGPRPCRVELSVEGPHSGSCSRLGNESNSLICVFVARVEFSASACIRRARYTRAYTWVIEVSHELMMAKAWETEVFLVTTKRTPATIGQASPSN